MVTRHIITRSLPAFLFLMALAVILILAGSATGFALGLVVVAIAALLLASMFIDEVSHPRPRAERSRYRRTQTSGF